ncbi:hypothetical protein [Aneurinibacillus tyrosinisolvens]|uniref:hypothetical protein n=1 Tax=Aneurinibacillus tyrosinisolvens TaxID=1443435 RepID=UPI00063F88A2|nr:hypothetical protein [Aneurinibacillus tyrosinisolvens]
MESITKAPLCMSVPFPLQENEGLRLDLRFHKPYIPEPLPDVKELWEEIQQLNKESEKATQDLLHSLRRLYPAT